MKCIQLKTEWLFSDRNEHLPETKYRIRTWEVHCVRRATKARTMTLRLPSETLLINTTAHNINFTRYITSIVKQSVLEL
jgi:predicted DNA binding CopG/RHH family protein